MTKSANEKPAVETPPQILTGRVFMEFRRVFDDRSYAGIKPALP